jgi:hypothetical protein
MTASKVIAVVLWAAVAAAPALAAGSAFDGQWMAVKADGSLDLESIVNYKIEKKTVEMSAITGFSYKAKVDGPDVPVEGDPNASTVSVSMPAKNVLIETSKRAGKPWQQLRMEVDAGGKTAKVTWKSAKGDKAGSYSMAKQ